MALFRRRSQKVEALREVPLFASLSKKQLDEVAKYTDEISVPAGEVLTKEGDLGSEFFLLVQGKASVHRNNRKLASRGAGEFFGEMSLLDRQPRSATVIADEDCVLLLMHRRDFSRLLDSVPGMSRKLLAGLSHRLREADGKLVS